MRLELLPPIRQDGDKSRKLYTVPNKPTKPMDTPYLIHRDVKEDEDAEHDNEGDDEVVVQKADQDQLQYIISVRLIVYYIDYTSH